MTSSIGQDFEFEVYAGNIKVLTFQLRQYSSKQPLDVSGANQILLEIETPDQTPVASIAANSAFPGANWAQGIVPVQIGPGDVTSLVGSWVAGLTIFIGGEEDTVRSGTIEVKRRPGYPAP